MANTPRRTTRTNTKSTPQSSGSTGFLPALLIVLVVFLGGGGIFGIHSATTSDNGNANSNANATAVTQNAPDVGNGAATNSADGSGSGSSNAAGIASAGGVQIGGTGTSTTGSTTGADVSAAPGEVIAGAGKYAATQWSAEIAPNAYRVAGGAVIDHDPVPGEFHYSDLDALGRPGACYAAITPQNYRDELSQDRETLPKTITGWHKSVKLSIQYPGSSSDKKTQNPQRSHQIADSIGGAGVAENLVPGSAFQNVGVDNKGGMCYTETKARDWLSKAADGSYLYYCVTPVYSGDELIPRSSYVDILSSDGSINEHVEVYNVIGDVQGRYYFDYATGEIIEAATGAPVS